VGGGYLADRYGGKPVAIAGVGLSALPLAAYALATTAPGFITVSAIAGATLGLYGPAGQAYAAELAEETDRDRDLALRKAARNAGFGIGFVAGGLPDAVQHVVLFVLDGATIGLFAPVLVAFFPRVHSGTRDVNLRASVGNWGRAITGRLIRGTRPLRSPVRRAVRPDAGDSSGGRDADLGLSAAALGTVYVLGPLVVVPFQFPFANYAQRWRRTRTLVVSAGFWAARLDCGLAAHDCVWHIRAGAQPTVSAKYVLVGVDENAAGRSSGGGSVVPSTCRSQKRTARPARTRSMAVSDPFPASERISGRTPNA